MGGPLERRDGSDGRGVLLPGRGADAVELLREDRRILGALAALTVLAFALRVQGIDESLAGDEILLFDIVHDRSLGGVMRVVHDTESTPPLFFILAWASAKLGDPTILIRLPSVLLGTAAVPITFALGRRTVRTTGALVGAAIVALAPFSLHYGTEARGYATLACLSAFSTLALLIALDTNRRRWWVAYALASVLVLYTHYTGVFVVAAQAVWALVVHRERLRELLVSIGCIGLALAPWIPSLVFQSRDNASERIELVAPLSWRTFRTMLTSAFPGRPNVALSDVPGTVFGWLLVAAIAAGLACLVVALVRDGARPRDWLPARGLVLLAILTVATPLGLLAYSVAANSLLLPRNVSASFPAAALLIGGLITSVPARLRVVSAVAVALVLITVAVAAARTLDPDYRRPDYRSVARFIESHGEPSDVVLMIPPSGPDNPLSRGLEPQLDDPDRVRFTGPLSDLDWMEGRNGRVFYVIPLGLAHDLPKRAGPGGRFVLRDERLYRGTTAVAVGEYTYDRGARDMRIENGTIVRPGADIPISAEPVRGSVDKVSREGRKLHVIGWAAAPDATVPADWVVAFAGRRLLGSSAPAQYRPDVAKALNSDRLTFSGFALDGRPPAGAPRGRVRVYAVTGGQARRINEAEQAREAFDSLRNSGSISSVPATAP
jgi:uncharacterized membrane protein